MFDVETLGMQRSPVTQGVSEREREREGSLV
jgi:hypothetical protein